MTATKSVQCRGWLVKVAIDIAIAIVIHVVMVIAVFMEIVTGRSDDDGGAWVVFIVLESMQPVLGARARRCVK